ncbi:tryptophan halogenase family protein [Sphingomicrobium aestuariivivum]|uniref:tryptophan halogenase family protein n=1 Tax=Sphingomicrobium aestuariivivum TaxID=1582356 RepID=UPI001FD71432|nr:tryptophan halogenase family protein [Sphingomicrobium aestuariivivum]MCJ8191595.1 tryptophan 7-halogenase [Sphingomicrobium aestuariivivum]
MTKPNRIQRLTILGGGTAGWMAAIAFARVLGHQVKVTLVESEAIGTVGVGEATIPPIKIFNQLAGLEEDEFLRQTKASLKLGIEFSGWGGADDRYIHLFGNVGQSLGLSEFFQYWLRAREEGIAKDFDLYSLTGAAARAGKAERATGIRGSKLEGITYAFHFDAGLYARYLRSEAEKLGVDRIEGKVAGVERDAETGFVTALKLEDGQQVGGEFFIDCSGFRALLIGEEMGSAYSDWTHWLPCNRAVAVPCENGAKLRPFTQSIAHKAGWQWRIPLQHRTGNGHVFSSAHMSEDEATQILLDNLEGEPIGDPRVIRFTTGMRPEMWKGNVAALGLASGFLEPLESTSIHLIQVGISKLMSLWPDTACDPALAAEYNRKMAFEYESVRDFIIAHYHVNQRPEPFWRQVATMDVPDSLQRKLDVFKSSGKIYRDHDELFTEIGWFQVLMGQNFTPERYHPLADRLSRDQLAGFLGNIEQIVGKAADQLPSHEDFLASIGAPPTLKETAA